MANLTFHSYRRSPAATGAERHNGRLKGQVKLTLTELNGGRNKTHPVDFLLMGPRDVSGLKPGAVRRTYPVNGAFNVETDKCPYVEFAADDLPWRYSPDPDDAVDPWLLLVVGTVEEVRLLPGNRVVLSQEVVNSYIQAGLMQKSHLWAHVQEQGGMLASRLLSSRPLQSSQSYVGALVPAFDSSGARALPAQVPISAYFSWHFTTSDTLGSFVDLAKRLYPLNPIPDNLGQASVAYQTKATQTSLQPQMLVGGALVGLNSAPPTPLPPVVSDHFAPIRPTIEPAFQHDNDGRPLVRLPLYGEPWLRPGEAEPTWMAELNSDPRHRGVVGLGMWAGIAWQDRIVEAASKQLGAFYTAARRIRQLNAGLAAARSLWNRRLPADEMQRIQVLGLALPRLAADQGGSVLDHITADGRPLPPALFSSAARRMVRPGPARSRLAQPSALAPAALLEQMNTCPPDSEEHPVGLLHVDSLCDGSLEQVIGIYLDQAAAFDVDGFALEQSIVLDQEERQAREEIGLDDNRWFETVIEIREQSEMRLSLLGDSHAPYPTRPCESEVNRVKLPKLSAALYDAFNPHGADAFIVQRVLATIEGLDDQPLTPPELCLDFHIPAWKFLNEFAKDWFLPGLAQMHIRKQNEAGQLVVDPDKDPVIVAETNGRFTDAFLIGFNQQALAELRWRNVPVAAGCTPLRRFWEPLRPDPPISDGEPGEDIIGLQHWTDNTLLGDAQHETPEANGDNLVLIFKSQLWRRYPETLIYLVPDQNDAPDWEADHIEPNLHVEIDRDVVAFGFAQSATILDTHWVVVEQVPRGLTFYNLSTQSGMLASQQPNSANFATTAFARPVRVSIRGTKLKPQPL